MGTMGMAFVAEAHGVSRAEWNSIDVKSATMINLLKESIGFVAKVFVFQIMVVASPHIPTCRVLRPRNQWKCFNFCHIRMERFGGLWLKCWTLKVKTQGFSYFWMLPSLMCRFPFKMHRNTATWLLSRSRSLANCHRARSGRLAAHAQAAVGRDVVQSVSRLVAAMRNESSKEWSHGTKNCCTNWAS